MGDNGDPDTGSPPSLLSSYLCVPHGQLPWYEGVGCAVCYVREPLSSSVVLWYRGSRYVLLWSEKWAARCRFDICTYDRSHKPSDELVKAVLE